MARGEGGGTKEAKNGEFDLSFDISILFLCPPWVFIAFLRVRIGRFSFYDFWHLSMRADRIFSSARFWEKNNFLCRFHLFHFVFFLLWFSVAFSWIHSRKYNPGNCDQIHWRKRLKTKTEWIGTRRKPTESLTWKVKFFPSSWQHANFIVKFVENSRMGRGKLVIKISI